MKKIFIIATIVSITFSLFSSGVASASKVRDMSQTMSDESSSYDFYNSIQWGYESGVFDGFKDGAHKGEFLPYNPITRAEFLKMLFNAKHDNISASYDKKCFSDSEKGIWYNKFLCYSKEKGYIKGYNNGLFKPNNSITIAEAYKILVNAYGFTASNDIMDRVFVDQYARGSGGDHLIDHLRTDKFQANPSKWFYSYFSTAHNMGIRFDKYLSKELCKNESDGICNIDAHMDQELKRGQMINMIYQFQAIAESKALADVFVSGFKEKNGSKMYTALDSASKSLELSESRFSGIVSELPIRIISSEFKGAYFYNGVKKTKAYDIDGSEIDSYKDISGTLYSRNALRLGYEILATLGDGSANEIVKLSFYPIFILENGEWKLHEEENRFYRMVISDKSRCKEYTDSKVYGFMGYLLIQSPSKLCRRSSTDHQENVIESIGAYKYGLYTINDYNGGEYTYPLGQSSHGIPKIGDIWDHDNFEGKIQ